MKYAVGVMGLGTQHAAHVAGTDIFKKLAQITIRFAISIPLLLSGFFAIRVGVVEK